MSGKNVNILNIPPGVNRNASQYAVGPNWYDVNWVRWFDELLVPIGGWVTNFLFTGVEPIRNMISWRDLLKEPWVAAGASDKLWGVKVGQSDTFNRYDITPVGLSNNPGGLVGYGRGAYGSGAYGLDSASGVSPDANALWSLDNFGKLLVSVHSQDGRLCSWDPVTPTSVAQPITQAPIDNTLVISTEEEYLMVLGGKNNPRRVKWASQRSLTDWTPTESNTAGGFDLRSNGAIVAAVRVQGGILVLTDSDIHMIEYVGPPNYYGRRRISEEGGILGKNCIVSTPRGAIWISGANFWMYDGAVSKIPCPISSKVFYNSDLTQAYRCHMGVNEFAQEVWFFYPKAGGNIADQYAILSYSTKPYWSMGVLHRTAWLDPCWQAKPFATRNQNFIAHEVGITDDGVSRTGKIYAETGAMEIGDGDKIMRADRIYPDVTTVPTQAEAVESISMTFKLAQAPNSPPRIYGPLFFDSTKGYRTVRFRARQAIIRVDQVKDTLWQMGKTRIRIKEAGLR